MQIKFNSPLLRVGDLKDPGGLIGKLRDAQDPLSHFLQGQLSPALRGRLAAYRGSDAPSRRLQQALVNELNQVLRGECLYTEERFAHVKLSAAAQEWHSQNPPQQSLIRLNRFLLEDAYPQQLGRNLKPKPIWKQRLNRKQKLVVAVSLVIILPSFGFFKAFWRAEIPSDLFLPPDTKLIVSRAALLLGPAELYNVHYIRGWCRGRPREVALAWEARIKPIPQFDDEGRTIQKTTSPVHNSWMYEQSIRPLEDFFPSVYAGPPYPTSEVWYLPYPSSNFAGSDVATQITLWPDGENTQFEVLISADHNL